MKTQTRQYLAGDSVLDFKSLTLFKDLNINELYNLSIVVWFCPQPSIKEKMYRFETLYNSFKSRQELLTAIAEENEKSKRLSYEEFCKILEHTNHDLEAYLVRRHILGQNIRKPVDIEAYIVRRHIQGHSIPKPLDRVKNVALGIPRGQCNKCGKKGLFIF